MSDQRGMLQSPISADWRRWGPYLSERQWGTVREDYSADGSAWTYFPHDHARSRAYRWGEDGLGGFCDDQQRICIAVALWNERDPILKERLFGLTGPEGNHGEDVKELYYYLDATPSASYAKMLYKYPQAEFPYGWLVDENRRRGKQQPEFELIDTGLFTDGRYFDVLIEYAKASADDILLRITAHNRGPAAAPLHILPHVWFRNTWSWTENAPRPQIRRTSDRSLTLHHDALPAFYAYANAGQWLLCDNETNTQRLYQRPGASDYPKDAFHRYVVDADQAAVNPLGIGTKAAAHTREQVPVGGSASVLLRLTPTPVTDPFADAEQIFSHRTAEADTFYGDIASHLTADEKLVQRQAFAGMVWSKQFYHIDIHRWIKGDATQPPPPASRRQGRNVDWEHLNNADVISMPDKWEYPWYAAWDLAFHCIPLARIDPEFAKDQLLLLTREWYMHPNGQLPAYEWAFGDVNPPVHAWATYRVFQIDSQLRGRPDHAFLERIYHKLLLNFTWWVNRKDPAGQNIFQGGFLGLDNIGIFDRSAPLPTGGHLEQADGTSWMAMYSLNMMRIALELSRTNPIYQDTATKFFEHFLGIAGAMFDMGGTGDGLWCPIDEFYYDVLRLPNGERKELRVKSMVGLIPLFAVDVLEHELLARVPEFNSRLDWFLNHRPDLAALISRWHVVGKGESHLLSLLRGHRMKRLLKRMLNESEFLSPFGVRAMSREHDQRPYQFHANGTTLEVRYQPAESDSHLFGGNSNWRGPIWMPVNYLLIESLRSFHRYYGDDFRVEYPTGSGQLLTISAIADELTRRLCRLFLRDENGRRPIFGDNEFLQKDPYFRDHILFYEYFHGDNGRGVGASHQTGWTGLVATLLSDCGGTCALSSTKALTS